MQKIDTEPVESGLKAELSPINQEVTELGLRPALFKLFDTLHSFCSVEAGKRVVCRD